MKKKRIAIVVQRYGELINGGAEQHARRIAERLVEKYDVSVITTTALHANWSPVFQEGAEKINGVTVHRFNCDSNHKSASTASIAMEKATGRPISKETIQKWITGKGPCSPRLVQYIIQNRDSYEAFLFVTYLFYHSVMALPHVRDKAIFLPTAHDEPPFYFYDVYSPVFCGPKDLLFNSVEEQELVHRVYRNEAIRSYVVGEGVDTPETVDADRFKQKYQLKDYIVYVGRIGTAKQCDVMLRYFTLYKQKHPGKLKLVLVGRSDLPKLENDDIVLTGFITDQEKFDAMAGAKCLVMPSMYESLCMAVLEALSVGTPVLVNAKCAVTRGHCKRGNCGLYYRNYEEFEGCLNYILKNDAIREIMGENGKQYVRDNYNWDTTLDRIDEIMVDYN